MDGWRESLKTTSLYIVNILDLKESDSVKWEQVSYVQYQHFDPPDTLINNMVSCNLRSIYLFILEFPLYLTVTVARDRKGRGEKGDDMLDLNPSCCAQDSALIRGTRSNLNSISFPSNRICCCSLVVWKWNYWETQQKWNNKFQLTTFPLQCGCIPYSHDLQSPLRWGRGGAEKKIDR